MARIDIQPSHMLSKYGSIEFCMKSPASVPHQSIC